MIVCLCEGLSDGDIKRSINSGAHSVQALGRQCGAGVDCGRCRNQLRGILDETDCDRQRKTLTSKD